jgi:hypothetical protein
MPDQFTVPQNIDVEDKIFASFTVRQFLIMLGGMAAIFVAYQVLVKIANQLVLFIISAVGLVALTMLFAFIQVNGRPFHLFLLTVLQSVKNPRLRLWNNITTERLQYRHEPPPPAPLPTKAPLTQTKLARLALLVDTGGAFRDDEDIQYWGQTLPKQAQAQPTTEQS